MKLRVGTRGSRLALAQTQWVVDRLCAARPALCCETIVLRTTGDKILDRPLADIGDKGLFVGQIEAALLEDTIDLAVHSMKDLPAAPTPGLCLAKVWPRADRRDVLILREGQSLAQLPPAARLATGSKRRALQLLELRPGLQVCGIRGNVDTRLRKLREEGLDGLVLAAAGLERLGLLGHVTQYLPAERFLPAPAQGALALQLRAGDTALLELLNSLADPQANREVRAERAFLAAVGGSCQLPIGASARQAGDQLILHALLGPEGDGPLQRLRLAGPAAAPEALGQEAARRLIQAIKGGL